MLYEKVTPSYAVTHQPYGEAINPPEIIHSSLPLNQRKTYAHEEKPPLVGNIPLGCLEPRELYAVKDKEPEDGGKKTKYSYMEPTTSSFLRRRSRLNLREKIFNSDARKPSPSHKCPVHTRSTSRDKRQK